MGLPDFTEVAPFTARATSVAAHTWGAAGVVGVGEGVTGFEADAEALADADRVAEADADGGGVGVVEGATGASLASVGAFGAGSGLAVALFEPNSIDSTQPASAIVVTTATASTPRRAQ
ncbi:MAG: hypothetical protein M0Z51_00420 [Propionibacterium sp.]|nr:hypothetical protein [Propionibacterium sp.]